MTHHRDRPDDWRDQAACADNDPLTAAAFHGDEVDQFEALRICRLTCPVVEQCRTYVDHIETTPIGGILQATDGIYAGETAQQRKVRRDAAQLNGRRRVA